MMVAVTNTIDMSTAMMIMMFWWVGLGASGGGGGIRAVPLLILRCRLEGKFQRYRSGREATRDARC